MPRAKKSPSMWYARARAYQTLADSIPEPVSQLHQIGESKLESEERTIVHDLVRAQLRRMSEKCWAEGGRALVERLKREADAARGRETRRVERSPAVGPPKMRTKKQRKPRPRPAS